jgi:Domain of unknown function (DUF4157)
MADHHVLESSDKAALRRRVSASNEKPGEAVHPLLRLQGQVGNAHIARLLAQRAGPEEDELQASHDLAQRAGPEEDELQASHDLAQRAGPEEDELQAKHDESVGVEGGPVGPETASQIDSMRGGGAGLEEGTRTSMEGAFGADFSDVRVHVGREADTLNRRLTARAFTTGNDIFLRGDANPSDSRLMAHELTHVVQQRSMSGGGGMHVGAAGDSHEQHADSVADTMSRAAAVPTAAAPTAQRAGEEDELQALHDLAQREGAEEEEQPG